MCITVGAAKLSNTIVYAAERTLYGKTVHVLGYQNKAENYTRGINAMILPIPAKALSAENMVDMSQHKDLLKTYFHTVNPPLKGGRYRSALNSRGFANSVEVSVFKNGAYTVIVANEPSVLPEVVKSVDESVTIDAQLMEEYAKYYDGWRVAVCLFEASLDSEPLFFHYEPLYPEHLFIPTLDAHDGKAPHSTAKLDHTIVFGMDLGQRVHWTRGKEPTTDIAPLFADRIGGFGVTDYVMNGDYWLQTSFARALIPSFVEGATLHLPPGVRP